MLLVGSRAVAFAFPDAREPGDWDLIARRADIMRWLDTNRDCVSSLVPSRPGKHKARLVGGESVEIEEIDGCPSAEMLETLRGLPRTNTPLAQAHVVPPAYLAALKRSHAEWPVHWEKTMRDLHWLRARLGGDEREDSAVAAFYRARHAEHTTRFGARTARLAMSNEAFFAKSETAVQRVHSHDWLHEIVAYGSRPMFERFKRDVTRASLDRTLFEAAPLAHRLALVREEAMVIALERQIIPMLPKQTDAAAAYAWAVSRICTTLTSGWFRDFAIDNWPAVNQPDTDYVCRYLSQANPS